MMTAFTNVVSVREVEGNARRKQNPHPDSWFVVEILPGEKIQLTCSIPPSQSKSPAIKDR